MPCLNEERTLETCIQKALACFKRLGIEGEVVIADNGSTDRSVDIALAAGAQVITVIERGYGAALRAGIEASTGDFIIMADSDDSYDWAALDPFIEKANEGYDLIMGNRFRGGIAQGAMPPLHRYLGNPILSLIARIAFHAPVGDFHCGMRGFTRRAYDLMQLQTSGMEFATEMVASAARHGMKITEVPTKLAIDGRNRPPHLRSFRDGWRHLRFILSYAPDHIYLMPGMILLGLGIVLQIILATGPINIFGLYMGIHFLALGGMLSLIGFNFINMGVIAKVVLCTHHPTLRTDFIRLIITSFTLEKGLVTGALLMLFGLTVDILILTDWIRNYGHAMEDSTHIVFVGSQAIALGLNIMFSSFLLSLLLKDDRILKLTSKDST